MADYPVNRLTSQESAGRLITMTDITLGKSKKKYPTLCVRINAPLRSHLDNAAFVHGITRGEVVRRILTEHFSNPTFVTRNLGSYQSRSSIETPDTRQGPSGPFTDLSLFAKGANGPAGPTTHQPKIEGLSSK
jgi:hypothetical protein